MLRIVQIGPYPLSHDCIRGGVEASVFGLAQEQAKTSEVHVFDYPRIGGSNEVLYDGRVLVHRCNNTGEHLVSSSRQVRAMADRICALNPDACHIHGTGLFSWLMYRHLKRKGEKVVVTIHGLALVEKRNLLKKVFTFKRLLQYCYQGMVEKIFLSQLHSAIVDTEYVREMVHRYAIRKKPVMHVVPQGIKEDYFQINCSESSKTLLAVGSIGERKGHLLTLKAFEHVRTFWGDCKLIIVGSIANANYHRALLRAVDASRFRDDVIVRVDVKDDELKHLYETSHVFILHTEEESQGIVFAEAMATGMPVVATDVGGVPYVVGDGVSGLLSKYGDVEGFANHIIELLCNKDLWMSVSQSARMMAKAYHWQAITERIYEIYKGE